MKNSILILYLLFAGVTFGQSDLSYEQPLRAFNCKADSIVIYKVSDAVYNAPFRFLRVMQIRKLEVFDRDNVVYGRHLALVDSLLRTASRSWNAERTH